jgi:hypothetical protein
VKSKGGLRVDDEVEVRMNRPTTRRSAVKITQTSSSNADLLPSVAVGRVMVACNQTFRMSLQDVEGE